MQRRFLSGRCFASDQGLLLVLKVPRQFLLEQPADGSRPRSIAASVDPREGEAFPKLGSMEA